MDNSMENDFYIRGDYHTCNELTNTQRMYKENISETVEQHLVERCPLHSPTIATAAA
jgi:hypothetical protein